MKLEIKKLLLAGTALVAASSLSIPARAAAVSANTNNQTIGATTGSTGASGAAGQTAVQFTAPNITVIGTGLLAGGNGGANTTAGQNTGGAGGIGVDFNAEDAGSGTSTRTGFINNGGAKGGNGGMGSTGTVMNSGTGIGGDGGAGGDGVSQSADYGSLTGSAALTGGNGGTGGTPVMVSPAGNGGAGGNGAAISGASAITNDTGNAAGGNGGTGGLSTGGQSNTSGNGGTGGAAYYISGANGTLTLTGSATGGNGGTGAASPSNITASGNGGDAGNAVEIANTGTTTTLNILASSVVQAGTAGAAGAANTGGAGNGGNTVDAILINGTGAIVTNAGTIHGVNNDGVNFNVDGTSLSNTGTIDSTGGNAVYTNGALVTLSNTGAGLITTVDGNAVNINGGTLGTLTNTSSIAGTGNGNGVNVGSTITDLNNNSGTISTVDGTGVHVNGGGVITGLTNDGGTIAATAGNVVGIDTGGTIATLDNSGGTIHSTSGGNVVYDAGTLDTLINTGGTIAATDGGAAVYIDHFNGSGELGTLTNAGGTISAVDGDAIYAIYANVTAIDNDSGTIEVTGGNNAIDTEGGETVGSITNVGGHITATTGSAIYSDDVVTLLNNNSGVISATTGTAVNNGAFGFGGTITMLTNNGGLIDATGAGGTALLNDNGTIGTLDNDHGTIDASVAGGIAIDNIGGAISAGTNLGGTISATTGTAFDNSGGTTFDNTGGTISATTGTGFSNTGSAALTNGAGGLIEATSGTALDNAGSTLMLDNAGGTISATTGTALELDTALSDTLTNAGGLITSASTGNGTVYITADIGDQTVSGGTIRNTGTANSAVAINITDDQSGTLTFQGVHIIADGDTANSGHGIAIASTGNLGLDFDATTVVRGNINENDSGGDALTLTTSGTIIGNITSAHADDTLTINGGSITGNIDGGDGNDTLTINGGAINGNITFGTGANNVNVDSTFTTAGTITANAGSITDLTVGASGNLTINNTVNLGEGNVYITHGGVIDLDSADLTTAGTYSNDGTTVLNVGRTLSVLSLNTAPTDGVLDYRATSNDGTLTTGLLDTGATAANLSNQTVEVSYIGGGINPASRALIATGTGAATIPSAAVLDNSYLYDFSVVEGTGPTANNLYLASTQVESLASAAANPNNENVSNVLLGPDINSNDPQIAQIQANLNNASTRQAYNNVLSSTLPTVNDGAPTAAAGFTGQVFDVADSQLAMINTGDPTGVAAGDKTDGLHPWIQGFGQHADQDARNGVDGYEANTFGGAIGLDTRDLGSDLLGGGNVLGLSFAYGHSFVNSQDIDNTDTQVNTYQATLYGNHAFGQSDYFVAGMAALGYDRNDETRHDIGTIEGLDATGRYNSYQEAGRAEFGRNFRLEGNFAGAVLTPIASADYVHYDAESYTEQGGGGADLSVDHQNENLLNLGIGGRAEWLLKTYNGMQLKPDIHGSYQYDVLNDDSVDTTSSFAAGGGTFSTRGLNPSNSTFDIGAGLKLYNAGAWDFTATYDFTAKSDYTANAGMIRAAYKF